LKVEAEAETVGAVAKEEEEVEEVPEAERGREGTLREEEGEEEVSL
jgi:hypothetical protein